MSALYKWMLLNGLLVELFERIEVLETLLESFAQVIIYASIIYNFKIILRLKARSYKFCINSI